MCACMWCVQPEPLQRGVGVESAKGELTNEHEARPRTKTTNDWFSSMRARQAWESRLRGGTRGCLCVVCARDGFGKWGSGRRVRTCVRECVSVSDTLFGSSDGEAAVAAGGHDKRQQTSTGKYDTSHVLLSLSFLFPSETLC
jgi:hypothetical protein